MAAPNGIEPAAAGSDSNAAAIQQNIQQLPSGHLSQQPQSQIAVGTLHLTNPTWSAIHAHHSIQQQNTRQLLQHQHQQQPRVPYSGGNATSIGFATAAAENTSAVTESGSETNVLTDVNSLNNVIVNIASVNSPALDISVKGSVAFLAGNNVLSSNNSGNKIITNDGRISMENVRVIQQQKKTNALLGATALASSMVRFNLAPGWRRIKYNHEIIYISPSGAPLRNFTQVKEYLLSVGTCKCGLPCPFDLETFFEFDAQVPNALLDDDTSHNFCLHRSKVEDAAESVRFGKKSNKFSNVSKADSLVLVEAASHSSSMAIQEVRLLQKDAEKILNIKKSTTSSNVPVDTESVVLSQQQNIVHDKEITTIPLSKTPPWRKHALLSPHASSAAIQSPSSVKVDVPFQPSTVIKQRQIHHPLLNPVQTKASLQNMNQNEQLVKSSPILSNASHANKSGWPPKDDFNIPLDSSKLKYANKKRPNFKDDPTGYLNQQTAILHSSISTLHSPDGSSSSQEGMHQKAAVNAESSELVEGEPSHLTRLQVETLAAKPEIERSVVQVQQNCDISHMKHQQHLQFQQQLKRQNQLVRQHHEQLKLLQHHQPQAGGKEVTDNSGSRFGVSVASESPVLSSIATFTNRTADVTSTSFSGTPDSKNSTQGDGRSPLFHGNFAMLRSESPETFINRNLMQASSEVEIPKQQNVSNTNIGFTENSSVPRSIVTEISTDAKSLNISKSAKGTTLTAEMTDRASGLVTLGQSMVKNEKVLIQNSTASSDIQNAVPFSAHAGLSQQDQVIPQQQQILMTPNAQIIVMSTQQNKHSCGTVIDGSSMTQNVIIPQQQTIMMSGANTAQYVNVTAASESPSPVSNHAITKVAGSSNANCSGIIQTIDHQKQHSQSSSNFLISSSNNLQSTVILNNGGNVVQSAVGGQQMLTANNSQMIHSGSILTAPNSGTKGISSAGGTGIITNQSGINHLLGSNNSVGMLGQSTPGATVVLNSLPSNSFVIQHQSNFNAATDGRQLVNQVLNLDGTTTSFVQQQQLQNLISPDSKRKTKKRKSSGSTTIISPGGSLPQQASPQVTIIPSQQQQQSPIAQQTLQPVGQSGAMLQLTPQYPAQSFQLSPSISGLTIMPNKTPQQSQQQQQQIILQNGQIISQPYNIISQQLLLPAGIVMAPDATTLVQIQNVAASCSNIITPQGMIIRAPGPHQSKSYLSASTGQQFIVNNTSQVSPMGTHQIYGGPVNIVVPQQQASTTQASHFIHQQGASLLQQSTQQHLIQHKAPVLNNNSIDDCSTISGTPSPHLAKSQKGNRPSSSSTSYHQFSGTTSPPDTTTHSPHSPEYASSDKSGESVDNINVAMVQCVSSSEPDLVSPTVSERAHSPSESSKFFEQSGFLSQKHSTSCKPSESKTIRIQASSLPQSPSSFIIHGSIHGTGIGHSTNVTTNIPSSNRTPSQTPNVVAQHHHTLQHPQMAHGSSSTTAHDRALPDSRGVEG